MCLCKFKSERERELTGVYSRVSVGEKLIREDNWLANWRLAWRLPCTNRYFIYSQGREYQSIGPLRLHFGFESCFFCARACVCACVRWCMCVRAHMSWKSHVMLPWFSFSVVESFRLRQNKVKKIHCVITFFQQNKKKRKKVTAFIINESRIFLLISKLNYIFQVLK